MFWIPMAIGAGVGLLKNKADKERADRMNQAAATQTMYSPHTGMRPGQITQAPTGLEAAMQGAMAGAQFGMAGQNAGWWGQGAGAGAGAAGASGGQMMAGTQGSNVYQNQQFNPWANNAGGGMYA